MSLVGKPGRKLAPGKPALALASVGGSAQSRPAPKQEQRTLTRLRAPEPSRPTEAAGHTVLIEAAAVEGTTLKVKPAVFLSLLDRMPVPLVAHSRRRLGRHRYWLHCQGFTVETESNRALPLPERSRALPRPGLTMHTIQGEQPASGGLSRVWDRSRERGEPGQSLREYYTRGGYYVSEWWNTDDDPALSVARMRVTAGSSTRPYRLRGITERYLFLAGHGLLELDGVTHKVGPGTGVLIRPGTWRALQNVGDRDLGLLSICRPRHRRFGHESAD